MEGQILLLFPVVFPILAGILVLAGRRLCTDKRLASLTTAAVLLLQLGLVFAAVVKGGSLTLWKGFQVLRFLSDRGRSADGA